MLSFYWKIPSDYLESHEQAFEYHMIVQVRSLLGKIIFMLHVIERLHRYVVQIIFVQNHSVWSDFPYHKVHFISISKAHMTDPGNERHLLGMESGARPTNSISIEFKIQWQFTVLWFKMCSADHNNILHVSQQCHCLNVCKILLWLAECVMNKSILSLI